MKVRHVYAVIGKTLRKFSARQWERYATGKAAGLDVDAGMFSELIQNGIGDVEGWSPEEWGGFVDPEKVMFCEFDPSLLERKDEHDELEHGAG